MTYLCVPIFVESVEQARRDAALAAEAGADLVELRIDRLATSEDVLALNIDGLAVPCIVTCRPAWEGGEFEGGEALRLEMLDTAARCGARYLDIELAAKRTTPRPAANTSVRLILSAHDFKGRPDRLYNLITEMNAASADVNKVAWMARSIRDNIEAFEILHHRARSTIALCMGEAGLLSRVLAKKFDAFLTFASLASDSATAPGQVTIGELKRLYRWDALHPRTKVYGVVGSPVAHSMSPAIHNAAFEQVGHDGVYLPMLVNAGYESFKAFMESFLAFAPLDLSGLSVTIPHKENALRYLKEKSAEIEPLAERIGTINTIRIDRDGNAVSLRGINTDYAAILDTITSALGIGRAQLAGERVGVIGAGGTGRTAVAALAHYGAEVSIFNRTAARAEQLADAFNGHRGSVTARPLEKIPNTPCRIWINTTSVGMHPNTDDSPFDLHFPELSPVSLVFDTIYNPVRTKLLQQAERAGARTVSGVEMFVRQAVGQFELWTGQAAPVETMRQVLLRALPPAGAS